MQRIKLQIARHWILAFCALAMSIMTTAASGAEKEAGFQAKRVALIRFDDSIRPLSEQFLYRKLDAAKEADVGLIVIEIDSEGGQLDVMDRMIERIQSLPTRTVAYVPRQALSAAAILSLACDEIVIGPRALFGDAGPIFMDEGFMFQHVPEKIRSHLAEQVRTLAENRGRPPALAEAMVDMDLVVYKVQSKKDQTVTYLSQNEIDSSDDPNNWVKLNPVHESREEHFFEASGKRAVELGLADANVRDRDDVKVRYGAEEMLTLERTQVDSWILILNHPVVTGLLFVVGLIALYIEFASPGIGVGGLLSIVCFSLFFWSRFFGGTAEWLEVFLFLAGLALMAVELFVLPGFGIWGLSGLILMGTSLIMASHDFFMPQDKQQWSELTNSVAVFMGSVVLFMVAAFVLTSRLKSVPGLNRLALKPPSINEIESTINSTSYAGVQIGDEGVADSLLRPAGKARFGNEIVDVVTEGTFADPGTRVRVMDVRGNMVVVREI